MQLDQSKIKLKTSLHALEEVLHRITHDLKSMQQENHNLKMEVLSLQKKLSVLATSQHDGVKQSAASKAGVLEMLAPNTVTSIDMSISELKHMVKNK